MFIEAGGLSAVGYPLLTSTHSEVERTYLLVSLQL